MKSLHSKLLGIALFVIMVGTPWDLVRGNAAANSSKGQESVAKKSHSQLVDSAVLVLVGAGLLAGAIVVRKIVPTQQ